MAEHPDDRFEAPDIATRRVLGFVFGFLVLAACALAGLYVYFLESTRRPLTPSVSAFPQPQLQTAPRDDLGRKVAPDRDRLDHYGWIDRDAGTIRIPIARAMEMIAARGPRGLDPVEGPAREPTPERGAPDRAAPPVQAPGQEARP